MALLTSDLFSGDPKLEAAATSNPAHVRRGARGDHVARIQTALNRIEKAGLATDGQYGAATARAVLAFKQKRDIVARPRQQQADDIVGIRTIKALDEEMVRIEARPSVPTFASVASPNPMFGDTDLFGFSLARLIRGGNGEWSGRDGALPACQMVPLGGTRRLVFTLHGGEGRMNFEFNGPGVCDIVQQSERAAAGGGREIAVTLRGLIPAETELSLRLDIRRIVTIRLIVRRARQRSLNVLHLGPLARPGDDTYILEKILPVMNWMFEPQINLTLVRGWNRIQRTLPLNDRTDAWAEPDPKKDLFVLMEGDQPPKDAAFVRWLDLLRLPGVGGAELLVFCGPNLKSVLRPSVGGYGPYRTQRCWVNIRESLSRYSHGGALSIVTAHELSHAMGAEHVTAPMNQHYLMNPGGNFGHVVIPSDTIYDFRIA